MNSLPRFKERIHEWSGLIDTFGTSIYLSIYLFPPRTDITVTVEWALKTKTIIHLSVLSITDHWPSERNCNTDSDCMHFQRLGRLRLLTEYNCYFQTGTGTSVQHFVASGSMRVLHVHEVCP